AGELRIAPGAGIELLDLGQRKVVEPPVKLLLLIVWRRTAAIGKQACRIRRALERQVVEDDELSVLRALDVDLDEVGALIGAEHEGRHGVLGRVGRCAPVRKDPWAGRKTGGSVGPRSGRKRRGRGRPS